MENNWDDLILSNIEDCEEILIDEEKLIQNANAGAMDQIVKDALKKDPIPKNFYYE